MENTPKPTLHGGVAVGACAPMEDFTLNLVSAEQGQGFGVAQAAMGSGHGLSCEPALLPPNTAQGLLSVAATEI